MIARNLVATGLLLLPAWLALAGCSGPEARAARYLERGEQYFADQNYDKARIEISNALQIDGKNAQARVVAGRIAEKQAKPKDAVGNYLAAVEADPDNIEARGALGRLYLLGGLPDQAREIIGPGLEKAPGDAGLLTVRGGLRAMEGDTAGALADAEAAVKAAPDNEIARALLAAQYHRAGRTEEAISVLRSGIEQHPESTELRLIMGDLQMNAGHTDQAEAQLQAIVEHNPTLLAGWQNLARFRLAQKNTEGAEQALRDAARSNPDSVEARTALVSFLAAQKGVEVAQQQMLEFVQAEPKNAELKLALAQFYQASGKAAEAETAFREVIAAEGVRNQGLVARDQLAAMLLDRAEISAAGQLIAEVLKENPRDNDALALRAGIALSRNETAAAITDLRSVLRDQPNSVPLLRVLARAHLQNHDTALAEEALRNAVQVNPADRDSRMDLAELLVKTGRIKLAMPILDQLVQEAPDDVGLREVQFRVQLGTGDVEAAGRTAADVRRLRPDLPIGYLMTAALLERDRKFTQAIAEYDLALRHAPDPMQVLPLLVKAQLQANQSQQAADRLTAFLQKQPDKEMAHELLGEVRLVQKNSTAAIASFDRAIALNPRFWVAYRGKALALEASAKPDLALDTLKQGYAASAAADLGVDLSNRLDRRGDHDAAVKVYEDMHQRNPDSLPIANNLAMMLTNGRGDADSLARADKLGEMLAASTEPSYLDTRGWIKYRRGQFEQALPLLQQASEKSPQSREIRYHLGMAQYRSGDRAAARASLEAALAGNKDFSGVEEARATLADLRGKG